MKFIKILLNVLLCVFVIADPLIPSTPMAHLHITLSDAMLFIIFAVFLIKNLYNKESISRFKNNIQDFLHDHIAISMAVLFAVMMISVTYSVERSLALKESVRFFTYIVLYFFIKYDIDKKISDNIFRSYFFITFVLCIFGIFQYRSHYMLSPEFYRSGQVRIDSTMENPNNYAAFLMLTIFPVITLIFKSKKVYSRIFYALLSLLILYNLSLCVSRNSLVGLAIGGVALIVFYNWKYIMAFCAAAIIVLTNNQFRERALNMLSSKSTSDPRISLWKIALKMIKDHPVLGVGNGNYVSLYDKYVKMYPDLKYENVTRFPVHSSYLKVESELGILGIAGFLFMIVEIFLKLKSCIKEFSHHFYKVFYSGFFASYIAFLAMNVFENLFFLPKTTVYFWMFVAISQCGFLRKE